MKDFFEEYGGLIIAVLAAVFIIHLVYWILPLIKGIIEPVIADLMR